MMAKCVLLSISQLTYLPPPWGDCKASAMDSDFFNTYSLTACRIDCETRYLVENCNCRMVHMPGRHCQTQTTSCQPIWLLNTYPCSCVHIVLTQGTLKSRPPMYLQLNQHWHVPKGCRIEQFQQGAR